MNSPVPSEIAMDSTEIYRFRLYVAGDGANSVRAEANLAELCRSHLADRSEVEIVDVFDDPMRAMQDGVFMTPTLLKLGPAPTRTIVGTLSQMSSVLAALGLTEVAV